MQIKSAQEIANEDAQSAREHADRLLKLLGEAIDTRRSAVTAAKPLPSEVRSIINTTLDDLGWSVAYDDSGRDGAYWVVLRISRKVASAA